MQQGFLSSEPYSIAQALGKPPAVLLIADAGFSAYQTTIAISRKLATEKKDLVQRFVDAHRSRAGRSISRAGRRSRRPTR